jgi:hypothetical protein
MTKSRFALSVLFENLPDPRTSRSAFCALRQILRAPLFHVHPPRVELSYFPLRCATVDLGYFCRVPQPAPASFRSYAARLNGSIFGCFFLDACHIS